MLTGNLTYINMFTEQPHNASGNWLEVLVNVLLNFIILLYHIENKNLLQTILLLHT